MRKKQVIIDGRMDPSNRSGWTNSNEQWTVVHMNRDFLNAFDTLPKDYKFPAYLQAEVKARRHMR